MKILYLDLETSGTNPEKHDILEIGMVYDLDWGKPIFEQPLFHCYVVHDLVQGQPYALWLNQIILKRIAERNLPENSAYTFLTVGKVRDAIIDWLDGLTDIGTKIVLGGKNIAGFDVPFLANLPGISKNNIGKYKLYHRTVDPAMLWLDPETDNVPPDLKTCLKRAGLEDTVSHTAIDDCYQTARCIRSYYSKGG